MSFPSMTLSHKPRAPSSWRSKTFGGSLDSRPGQFHGPVARKAWRRKSVPALINAGRCAPPGVCHPLVRSDQATTLYRCLDRAVGHLTRPCPPSAQPIRIKDHERTHAWCVAARRVRGRGGAVDWRLGDPRLYYLLGDPGTTIARRSEIARPYCSPRSAARRLIFRPQRRDGGGQPSSFSHEA